MDDIITNMRISLEKAYVQGVLGYIKKLQDKSDSPNFQDFLLEGRAALTFNKLPPPTRACLKIQKGRYLS